MNKRALTLSFFGIASLMCAAIGFMASNPQAQSKDMPNKALSKTDSAADGKSKIQRRLTIGEAIDQVDMILEKGWAKRGLKPSDPASDLEWLRRISLDMIGRVPTLEEVEAFEVNENKGKRTDFVNATLRSPEYAEYQAYLLRGALINTAGQRIRTGPRQLEAYLEESIADNKSWDDMTREMLTFSGEVANGSNPDAGGYILSFQRNLSNLTGNVSRAFLGIEIQCVQCHDDNMVPVEEGGFYQKDFQKMAAIFSRTRTVRKTNDRSNRQEYNTWVVRDERFRMPNARAMKRAEERIKRNPALADRFAVQTVRPTALRGPEMSGKTGKELREDFANWVIQDNKWFARTMVNRVWAHYLKRGFVEPVDDFSLLNDPSNPELLDFLTEDFMSTGYDLHRLTRIVVGTRAYQLSSELQNESSSNDRIYYSRAYVRQLGALETFNSIVATTQLDKTMERSQRRGLRDQRDRLLQSFTFSFDDDEDKSNESFSGTIPQSLMMMNGDFVNGAVSVAPGSQLYTILKGYKTVPDRIEAMYLASLTRRPTKSEASRMKKYITKEGNGSVAAYEDVFWALVNSAEYLVNH